MFRINKISAAIIASSATLVSLQSSAQDAPPVEEVLVTGIRASIKASMDIKRDSAGVVDSISAEDIGKFPDSNLAESLQRITGVSINRRDGEGAQITVRGFGPQYNSVTLNGRQMPNATNGRGFNFDTIAAEMVSGVDVFKTASAVEASGGIGASVNVKTAKPLDLGDSVAGQIKMLSDQSAAGGTPALSGLYSKVFDNSLGVLAAISYQEREFENDTIEVRRWRATPLTSVNGQGDDITLAYFPTQTAVGHTESELKRTNANVVFQYALSDTFTGSVDATYSNLDISRAEIESASWRTYSTAVGESWEADSNGTAVFHQFIGRGMDFFVGAPESREVSQQLGVNLNWEFSDRSSVTLDYSHSASERNPDQELEVNRSDVQGVDLDYTFAVTGDRAFHTYDGEDISLTSAKLHQQDIYSNNNLDEIDQARVDYVFDGDNLTLKAGVMYTDQTKTLEAYNNNNGENADAYTFRGKYDLVGDTNALFASAAGAQANGYRVETFNHEFAGKMTVINFDAEAASTWLDLLRTDPEFGGLDLVQQDDWSKINEKTLSAYTEATVTREINDHPIVIVAGVRIEDTTVDSTSLEQTLSSLEYVQDGEEYKQIFDGKTSFTDGDGYAVILPNMLVKYNVTDDVIVRFAASKTITRPELSNMKSSRTYGGYRAGDDFGQASAGNPDLEPFMSDNLDFSLEWYFDEASFVSAGYFKKIVDNFIVASARIEEVDGVFISDQEVDPDFVFGSATPVQSVYAIKRPRNQDTKTASGVELAIQYAFGESGFGVIANATLTDTDSPFKVDQTDESALLGLSDSANFVAFYDKGGIQARIAYNWRDSFIEKWGHVYSTDTGEPTQVSDFSQIDISASYDIDENLTVFIEGINVTSEDQRKYSRFRNQMLTMTEGSARYALGVRAKF